MHDNRRPNDEIFELLDLIELGMTSFWDLPPNKFTTDGCSGGLSLYWNKMFGTPPPFESCCLSHDIEYHYGSGSSATPYDNFIERLQVDNEFAKCLWNSCWQGKILCVPIWIAVRLGGGSYRNKSYSWGYGWNTTK